MKYKLTCKTDGEDITLNINAATEEDAEAIALTQYDIKEVNTIISLSKERTNNYIYDSMKRTDYPYIKNTGKSHVKIYT